MATDNRSRLREHEKEGSHNETDIIDVLIAAIASRGQRAMCLRGAARRVRGGFAKYLKVRVGATDELTSSLGVADSTVRHHMSNRSQIASRRTGEKTMKPKLYFWLHDLLPASLQGQFHAELTPRGPLQPGFHRSR